MDDISIDNILHTMKEEQEMDAFINNGIVPSRLKSTSKPIYMPKLSDRFTNTLYEHSYARFPENTLLSNLTTIMNKLECLENDIIKTGERELCENQCPICMDDMGDNNYLVPPCSHKVCIPCFISTIRKMGPMAGCCCLCRQNIISNA